MLEPICLFDVEPIDLGFATNGHISLDFGDPGAAGITKMLVESHKRILVAGQTLGQSPPLLRLTANGKKDKTFGSDGQALPIAQEALTVDHIYDMTTDSQERIIVTGSAQNSQIFHDGYIINRFLPSGSPDITFGSQGSVFFRVPAGPGQDPFNSDLSESVAVDATGRILVGGYAAGGWTVVRFLDNGTPDPSFGAGNGVASTLISAGDINALLPTSDGKVYAVGTDYRSPFGSHMSAMRLLEDGSPDPTFGTDGKINRVNNLGWGWTALLRPDGRLLMAGGEQDASNSVSDAVVYSVTADGSADPTFGQDGRAAMNFGDGFYSDARNMILRDDGTIVVVGDAGLGENSYPTIGAFDSSGDPVADFGTNGHLQLRNFFIVSAIAQDSKGQIIVGGLRDQATTQIEVSRFVPFPVLEVGTSRDASTAAAPFVLAAPSSIAAAAPAPQFVLSRTGDLSKPVSVQVSFTGAGTNGIAQGTVNVQVAFAAGTISVSLPLRTYGNLVLHGMGTVRMSVINSDTLFVLGSPSATLAYTAPPALARIGGTVFNDVNLNGKRDTGEGALAGRIIYIDKNRNGKLEAGETSVITDANGNYSFVNLAAGVYRIARVTVMGYRSSTISPPYRDIVVSGVDIAGVSFGLTRLALLSGSIFNDLNGSGHADPGEPLLSGRRIFIDANNDGKWESNERSVITTVGGAWSFNLPIGSYRVAAAGLRGWKTTTPSATTQLRTLAAGQILSGIALGVKKT